MRVHVVSDVHARADALAKAGDGADALICLGDLVLFLDYDDPSGGIFADMFGADAAVRLIELRTERRFTEAREFSGQLWASIGRPPREAIEEQIRGQYADLFSAMPTPAYVTYGNVDVPGLYAEYVREGITVLDGETTTIGDRTFGFIGGGLRTPMHTPYEISDEDYAAKVAAVGTVDVLCAHIPPDIPELLYDVEARRLERGSSALLEAIRDTQPAVLLYGHVHNPLVGRARIGKTECVNVGHFRGRGTPYVLEW
jgi:Icc-related predicted phosphoesterase